MTGARTPSVSLIVREYKGKQSYSCMFRHDGKQIMRAIALTDIAKLQADAEDFRQAEQNLLAALDLDRALKKVDWQVQDLRELGRVYRRMGDDARARAASEEAEKLAAKQGDGDG